MSRFSDALANLSADDVRANITMIKGVVKDQVESTDDRVHVELTDHFNHSFVPDMVLSWPGDKRERELFLRTAYRQPDLQRDINTLSTKKPILLPLRQVAMPEEQSTALRQSARGGDTLIASPDGLEALEDETEARPVVSLLSHNLLQGGRGVMTTDDAHETSTELDEGFNGAREGDTTRTSAAIEAAADLLDSEHAGRINRLLHAVWVGSGAAGSAFPGSAGVTAVLDAESLRFILELPDVDDNDFWRRLGAGLTLGRLCELGNLNDTENFQRLLRDNAYRLTGKAARVLRGGSTLDHPRWSVANSTLVLAVANDRIHFAPSKLEELPEAGEPFPVSVRQFQSTCSDQDIRVRQIRLSSGDNSVSYANEVGGDIIAADEVSQLQDVMPGASLTSAVTITEKHDLTLTFPTRTANGYGPARFPLATIARVVTPILISPEAAIVSAVAEMLKQPPSSQPVPDRAEPDQAEAPSIAASSDEASTEE